MDFCIFAQNKSYFVEVGCSRNISLSVWAYISREALVKNRKSRSIRVFWRIVFERAWLFVTMGIIWTGMVAISVLCGLATGRIDAVASGALEGAAAAVELCLSMTGILCLWMGVMEIMRRCGLSEGLARILRPILRRLFPAFAEDRQVMDTVAANMSANLLGLGNAATPLGMEAARQMAKRSPGVASDSLCMLVVCNTASIQLLPTTVASIRSAAGCAAAFDILPAVWLASGISVLTGVMAAKGFARVWPR